MPVQATPLQVLVEEFCQDSENLQKLLYIKDSKTFAYYQENEGYFKNLNTRQEFGELVYQYLKKKTKKNLSQATVWDAIQQIRWEIYQKVPSVQSSYFALQDQLLNLNTFECEPFSLDKKTFYKINVPSKVVMDSSYSIPQFQQFLDEVVVLPDLKPDKDLQKLIQEMFGYALLETAETHVTFFLVGDGANGKSVLLNILKEMIGPEFVTAMSLETLTTNKWALTGLIGKKVNICNEEESDFIKADKFKAIVAGDQLEGEHKHGDFFSLTLTMKFFFSTNEMPTFKNLNEGLMRRIKPIPFHYKVPKEKRDTKLTGKLLTELPGILAWAIEGAKRLVANNYHFTECVQTNLMERQLEESLSSAVMFFRERYEEDEGSFISNDNLYEHYVTWCQQSGKKAMSKFKFGGDLNKTCEFKSILKYDNEIGNVIRGRSARYAGPGTSYKTA